MKNKRLVGILSTIAVLLLIPLIAMQFSEEVNWTVSDFIAAGILLLSAGLALELVLQKVKAKEKRIALCIAIVIVLLLLWAELAVGVFGTPFAGS